MKKHLIALMVVIFLTCNLVNSFAQEQASYPKMDIKINLDISRQSLTGTASLDTPILFSGLVAALGKEIKITKITGDDGKKIPFTIEKNIIIPKVPKSSVKSPRALIYFKYKLNKQGQKHHGEYRRSTFSNKDYLMLLGNFTPCFLQPGIYALEVTTPDSLTVISEADSITESMTIKGKKITTFVFNHPRDNISLIAGHFFKYKLNLDSVTLACYLLTPRSDLADRLLQRLRWGLEIYKGKLPPFPFKRFQVVENPVPTGVTIPTVTLIGRQIIDKPFVLQTSIIHELVHSWFGNSVYVDYSRGNWCEGLTTYLADYHIQELQGRAKEYRHNILLQYKSYVHPGNSFPLDKFQGRSSRASQAIGYGKCAMVFHMLRKMMGDQTFFKALSSFYSQNQFRKASWKDIERAFSSVANIELDWYFNQWLTRADVPQLEIESAISNPAGRGRFQVGLTISQDTDKPYRLRLPVVILGDSGSKKYWLEISKKRQTLQLMTDSAPKLVVVDQGFNVMRDLDTSEFPPCIARLMGAEKKYIILAQEKERDIYKPLITFLKAKGFQEADKQGLNHAFFKNGSFLILGHASGMLANLAGDITKQIPNTGVIVKVKNNPFNPLEVASIIIASSREQMQRVVYKLPHYGKYGLLIFKNGQVVKKQEMDYESGLYAGVEPELSGILSKDIMALPGVIQHLKGPKVVYLGEKHDDEGIHQAQLKIIKALSKIHPVAVGMEMFQRPFQRVLNSYLQGKIDERQFLKGTEYFKRWGYNYHFYRPIIEFCKEHGIPVIALNLPSEISKKIARSGLDSLSDKEKRQLPPGQLDMSNRLYRQLLEQIYQTHQDEDIGDFEDFFQAQIAWDETMAYSISQFLKQDPSRQVIVIVGGGHVEFGYGIPSRVKRRIPSVSQAIVLFNQPSITDPTMADLFLFTPQAERPFVPKLGVLLKGKGLLTVEKVVKDSPAYQAGIKKGDIIVGFDGHPVNDIYDLKLELFFKKQGEKAKITVERKNKEGKVIRKELTTGPLVPFNWGTMAMPFHNR